MAVYKECILRGWTSAFIDAGCIVSTPTCGPCPVSYTHLDVYKRLLVSIRVQGGQHLPVGCVAAAAQGHALGCLDADIVAVARRCV